MLLGLLENERQNFDSMRRPGIFFGSVMEMSCNSDELSTFEHSLRIVSVMFSVIGDLGDLFDENEKQFEIGGSFFRLCERNGFASELPSERQHNRGREIFDSGQQWSNAGPGS